MNTNGCNFSISPLDDLIDQLGGVDCVAEMTGRKGRIVRQQDSKLKYELRDSDGEALESLNNTEVYGLIVLRWLGYSKVGEHLRCGTT